MTQAPRKAAKELKLIPENIDLVLDDTRTGLP